MFQKKFTFCGTGDGISVKAEDLYQEARGYGFLEPSAGGYGWDRFTGTGGFNPAGAGRKKMEAALTDSEYGVQLPGSGVPLRFRIAVPEKGVYAVSVTIRGGKEGLRGLNLYSNRRNLVKRDITADPGSTFTYRYYVHVCEYIPVVGEPMKLDSSIYVSVLGENARLSAISVQKSQAPTLFIAGDSLVGDYDAVFPYNPLINGGSWGQNILQYFDGLAVCNQAHGGMTTSCFRDDGHWEIVARNIQPGDIFMMQFGHNDQKRRNLKAFGQYAANLRWYIKQVRDRGAYPIIVTSMSRIPSRDGDGYYDLLEEYAASCLRVGQECHVPVIDLHAFSFQLLCGMGADACKDYFNDTTHTNDYGALVMVQFLADEIGKRRIEPLAACRNNFHGEPWIPDQSLRPAGAVSAAEKEERPILSTDLPRLPYADCRHIRQLDELKEAMVKGLLDPCIKYYHPFDEMPRGQFLYLFFKAAACPEKRPYQGRYCDIYRYEFDSQNVQAALDGGLIDESTTPDDRFRPDDALTGGELVSFMVRSLHKPGEREISLYECERQARSLGLLWEGYGRNAWVNRLDCTVALVHMMNLGQDEAEALERRVE